MSHPDRRIRTALIAAAVTAGLALGILVPTAAYAFGETTTTFSEAAGTVAFEETWTVKVAVRTGQSWPLPSSSGTVDLSVEGIAGVYVQGVPIFRGGDAFVTPAPGTPPLPAGTHRLIATFNPSAESGLVSSQTTTPYTLTIEPLALDANAELADTADPASPELRLWTSGEYVDRRGTPEGNWSVTVERDGAEVLSTTIAQQADTGVQTLVLTDLALPGRSLDIVVSFAPDDAVAGGVTYTDAEPLSWSREDLTAAEALMVGVPMPWWLLALVVAALLGLAAVLAVVILRARRLHQPQVAAADAETVELPTEPEAALDPAVDPELEPEPTR